MKKSFINTLIIILLLLIFNSTIVLSYNTPYDNQGKETKQKEELYEESLITLLYPYISSEFDKYYGSPKQFSFEKILSIKKHPYINEYEIIIEVKTFTGAHNPPRGKETITIITSSMGTKVVNFKHNEI